MNKSIAVQLIILSSILLSSCARVDLRTKRALENNKSDEEKGKELLEYTYLKMGYDKMKDVKTYSVNALFHWKMPWTLMPPMNALPGNKDNLLVFRNEYGTFDSHLEFLEGPKKGETYGIQAWQTYKIDKQGNIKQKDEKRYNWGLATYHYVLEAPKRLLGADIIRYAGETTYNGQEYDLVYATWGRDEPHEEHDQWLIYINKETGFTDLTQITINDFFLPTPNKMKAGTIHTERIQSSNGTYLPSAVYIQLGAPKKKEKYVYKFDLTNYEFNSFDSKLLTPLQDLPKFGDEKIQ